MLSYNIVLYASDTHRWLSIRLEFIGNLIILFAALFSVIQRIYGEDIHLPINGGLVGLSIAYALQVTLNLNSLVLATSELENNLVSVERTNEYSNIVNEVYTPTTYVLTAISVCVCGNDPQAPAIVDTNRPPDGWPSHGDVKFDHYSTRYREGLDLVIKDIGVEVVGGTKVGTYIHACFCI